MKIEEKKKRNRKNETHNRESEWQTEWKIK